MLACSARMLPAAQESELTARQKRALRYALAIGIARGELADAGDSTDAEAQAERAVSSQITRLWYDCARAQAQSSARRATAVKVGAESSFESSFRSSARGANDSVEVLCFAARSTVSLEPMLPAVQTAIAALDARGWDATAQSYALCGCLCAPWT